MASKYRLRRAYQRHLWWLPVVAAGYVLMYVGMLGFGLSIGAESPTRSLLAALFDPADPSIFYWLFLVGLAIVAVWALRRLTDRLAD